MTLTKENLTDISSKLALTATQAEQLRALMSEHVTGPAAISASAASAENLRQVAPIVAASDARNAPLLRERNTMIAHGRSYAREA